MSFLFEIYGKEVRPKPSVLLIEPFKTIWNDDKSKDKHQAYADFTYIEFMTSEMNSNPYKGYPQEVRKKKLFEDNYDKFDGKPHKLCNKAMDKLIEFQEEGSATYSYYMAAKKGLEKLKAFNSTVDLNERTNNGYPVYKPNELAKSVSETEKLLKVFQSLEKRVNEELTESVKTKAGKEISPFADPSSLRRN